MPLLCAPDVCPLEPPPPEECPEAWPELASDDRSLLRPEDALVPDEESLRPEEDLDEAPLEDGELDELDDELEELEELEELLDEELDDDELDVEPEDDPDEPWPWVVAHTGM
ncbi:MAG TPA: hypothetical protein PKE29_02670 [Phycisphaerales bacterium]|nr:hypothetical protein [Phycisphaerales bacterium]